MNPILRSILVAISSIGAAIAYLAWFAMLLFFMYVVFGPTNGY